MQGLHQVAQKLRKIVFPLYCFRSMELFSKSVNRTLSNGRTEGAAGIFSFSIPLQPDKQSNNKKLILWQVVTYWSCLFSN